MDNLKVENKTLERARLHHFNYWKLSNVVHKVFAYGNFVECDTCKLHAHLRPNDPYSLIMHNSEYTVNRTIQPGQFH